MPAYSLSDKATLRRVIDREWSQGLTKSEAKVVYFVFTNTIEWGKPAERLKCSHFVRGLGRACGTGLSDKTVRRCLDDLVNAGALTRKRTPRGYVLGINFEWIPTMLRVPKRLKEAGVIGQNDRSVIGQNDLSIREGHTYLKGHTSCPSDGNGGRQKSGEGRESPVTARAALDLANAQRVAAKAAGKPRKPSPLALGIEFAKAFKRTFPGVPIAAWGSREQGQAKLLIRGSESVRGFDPVDLVTWAVAEWTVIIGARFPYLDRPPEYPTIGFILRFKDQFFAAWGARETLRRELALTPSDRRIKRLERHGMTHEEAVQETAGRDEVAAERVKLAEERRKLNDMLQRAEQRETSRGGDERFLLKEPKRIRAPLVRPKSGS